METNTKSEVRVRILTMSASRRRGCPIRQVLFALIWPLWLLAGSGLYVALSFKQTTTTAHSSTHQMAIAPITGKLRKRFWVDLTTALGLGVGAGYAYWCVLFDTRLSPSKSMLTGLALGMGFTSRAVSLSIHRNLLFDECTDHIHF